MADRPRGRFAPSPTGEMHLGNASSALLAWLSVRARGGTMVLRMEDLDRARSRAEFSGRLLDDLAWLGLDWDEGPDLGGPYEPYEQSKRTSRYEAAFGRLIDRRRVYPCFCSRRDIAGAASAPQEPGDERRYPGTCRAIDSDVARARVETGERHAWRFRVDPDDRPRFLDLVRGPQPDPAAPAPGDFVVRRSDGDYAYQLAVVVDDAAMRIDEVVRGDDLLPSTARQLLLYEALDLAPPRFGHVPLLLDPEGFRLSKRQQGITLQELRDAGVASRDLVGRLAAWLGLRPEPAPLSAAELVRDFSLAELPLAPEGIVVSLEPFSG